MSNRGIKISPFLVISCAFFCFSVGARSVWGYEGGQDGGDVGVKWYVDDDGPGDPQPGDPTVSDPLEDGSAGHPFDRIQEAIDAAAGGDTIIVEAGVYQGNIYFKNKNIKLRTTAPGDPTVAAGTIIQGDGTYSAVIFSGLEGLTCELSGFTVTGGFNNRGGGILGNGATAKIDRCIIRDNHCTGVGGGIYGFKGTISNCVIRDNTAGNSGGGLGECSGTIVNCLICDNRASFYGGALHNCDGKIVNVTAVNNRANSTGVFSYCDGQFSNCIVWGNTLGTLYLCNASFRYCCLEWPQAGVGNINVDPVISAIDSYKIKAGSPCIDAGDNTALPSGIVTDITGTIRILDDPDTVDTGNPGPAAGALVDMGAYEFAAGPRIFVTPKRINFFEFEDGINPSSQKIYISNTGEGALSWAIEDQCGWLEVNPLSGSSTGPAEEVELTAALTGLTAGEYLYELTISDPAASNNPQTVEVLLKVQGPILEVSASVVEFTVEMGGPAAAPQTFTVVNAGGGILNWEIDYLCDWLTVSPLSGGSAGEPNEVGLNADISGLAGGDYNCLLTVSDPQADNSPQTVEVILHVLGPMIELSDRELEFLMIQGGPNPPDQALLISNSGKWILQWEIMESCSWLQADPVSGSSTGQAQQIKISIEAANLEIGTYTGKLTVVDANAANSPQIVTVILHVKYFQIHVPGQALTIQEAIDHVIEGGEVIVADGTYKGAGNRDLDFKGRAITVRSEKGPENCIIDCQGSALNPRLGFYFRSGEGADSVLEGFTITGGNTGDIYHPDYLGGAIFIKESSPVIRDCIIRDNYGHSGTISCFQGFPLLSQCLITNNSGFNAIVWMDKSRPVISGCTIKNNDLTTSGYGAIACRDSSPTINNCIIRDNFMWGIYIYKAGYAAVSNCLVSNNERGGIDSYIFSHFDLDNCTIVQNNGPGVFYNDGLDVYINNSIIWDNSPEILDKCGLLHVAYSNIGGGWPGQGNISADPIFVNDKQRDYRLEWHSPGVDVGTNTPPAGLAETDLAGNPRLADGDGDGLATVDMGAYEYRITEPFIGLSAAEFDFYGYEGGADPNEQVLTIRNGGGIGTINWTIDYNCPWLSLSPASGSSTGGPNDVILRVYTAGLKGGDYRCTLFITAPEAINSPRKVEVSLHVIGPIIELSKQQFEFDAEVYGPNPPDQTCIIANRGGGTLNWQISDNCGWAAAEPDSGSIGRNQSSQVALKVDITGLKGGDHDCYLYVYDPQAENSPQKIKVALHLNGPVINLSPSDFEFEAPSDGSAVPAAKTLIIGNIGAAALNWQVNHDCDWLRIEPSTGSCPAGETDEVTIGVDPSGLPGGNYYCWFTFSDPMAENSPQTVSVHLLVNRILRVPTDYSTIQMAINAAYPKDHVVVADGTYTGWGNRDLYFGGKAITVRSANGPENCIIDVGGTYRQRHNGFMFFNRESLDSVLDGFTIINGYQEYGGGIYCYQSSPTIRNCILSGNTASYGGGICCIESKPVLDNCIIEGNSAYDGAGISCVNQSDCVIEDSIISKNSATHAGGGIYCQNNRNCRLKNCFISKNSADNGGGIYCFYQSNINIANGIISENISKNGGGGIYCFVGDLSVINSIISGNHASYGGGLYGSKGTHAFTNCTITGNKAVNGGGILGNNLILNNNILWANMPEQIRPAGSMPIVRYCNVQGGWPGEQNINADPEFVKAGYWDPNGLWTNGDYHLRPGSPCIDAGGRVDVYEDIAGNIRPWDCPGVDNNDPNIPDFDIGAYEFFALKTALKITPRTLNCRSKGNWVKAHFTLPEGYMLEDVDVNRPAIIEPLGIESDHIDVFINEARQVEITAAFDREAFCGATGNWPQELNVFGVLTSGEFFYGTAAVRIIAPRLKEWAGLAAFWLQAGCKKPHWCEGLDLNRDSMVNLVDFALLQKSRIEFIYQ